MNVYPNLSETHCAKEGLGPVIVEQKPGPLRYCKMLIWGIHYHNVTFHFVMLHQKLFFEFLAFGDQQLGSASGNSIILPICTKNCLSSTRTRARDSLSHKFFDFVAICFWNY